MQQKGRPDIALVARRNNSLSRGGRLLILGSLAAVVLPISLGFALSGAWLVFPRRTGTAGGGSGIPTTDEQRAAMARPLPVPLRLPSYHPLFSATYYPHV